MRYKPYAHVVNYVLLVGPVQVPNKEAVIKLGHKKIEKIDQCLRIQPL